MERFYEIKVEDEIKKVAVVTSLSGNIRFIHLMEEEEYERYKESKLDEENN